MMSILRTEAAGQYGVPCAEAPVQQARALEGSELDQVVGGLALGQGFVRPAAWSLTTFPLASTVAAGSLVGPVGLFPSRLAQGRGALEIRSPSGGLSTFTGGGSDRGEP